MNDYSKEVKKDSYQVPSYQGKKEYVSVAYSKATGEPAYIWGPTYKSVAQDFVKTMNKQGISHHKLVHMSEVVE